MNLSGIVLCKARNAAGLQALAAMSRVGDDRFSVHVLPLYYTHYEDSPAERGDQTSQPSRPGVPLQFRNHVPGEGIGVVGVYQVADD